MLERDRPGWAQARLAPDRWRPAKTRRRGQEPRGPEAGPGSAAAADRNRAGRAARLMRTRRAAALRRGRRWSADPAAAAAPDARPPPGGRPVAAAWQRQPVGRVAVGRD